MKIAILGTGHVGQTFAEKLTGLGHEVIMGTRNVEETLARTGTDNYGSLPFGKWHEKNTQVMLATFAEAVQKGELIINALQGAATLPTFGALDAADTAGKIIIDIANPLDFSQGFPPSLLPGLQNTYSLGEALQKLVPHAHVVKTLNTMYCGIMVSPAILQTNTHINYICGNDAAAKATVVNLLNSFGWENEQILDLGDITNARGTESILLIWTRVYAATQNGAFNFALVR